MLITLIFIGLINHGFNASPSSNHSNNSTRGSDTDTSPFDSGSWDTNSTGNSPPGRTVKFIHRADFRIISPREMPEKRDPVKIFHLKSSMKGGKSSDLNKTAYPSQLRNLIWASQYLTKNILTWPEGIDPPEYLNEKIPSGIEEKMDTLMEIITSDRKPEHVDEMVAKCDTLRVFAYFVDEIFGGFVNGLPEYAKTDECRAIYQELRKNSNHQMPFYRTNCDLDRGYDEDDDIFYTLTQKYQKIRHLWTDILNDGIQDPSQHLTLHFRKFPLEDAIQRQKAITVANNGNRKRGRRRGSWSNRGKVRRKSNPNNQDNDNNNERIDSRTAVTLIGTGNGGRPRHGRGHGNNNRGGSNNVELHDINTQIDSETSTSRVGGNNRGRRRPRSSRGRGNNNNRSGNSSDERHNISAQRNNGLPTTRGRGGGNFRGRGRLRSGRGRGDNNQVGSNSNSNSDERNNSTQATNTAAAPRDRGSRGRLRSGRGRGNDSQIGSDSAERGVGNAQTSAGISASRGDVGGKGRGRSRRGRNRGSNDRGTSGSNERNTQVTTSRGRGGHLRSGRGRGNGRGGSGRGREVQAPVYGEFFTNHTETNATLDEATRSIQI